MNKSLFDGLPAETAITLAPADGATTLTPAQAAFNKLLKQIEQKRAQITEWQNSIGTFQQKYTLDLLPILQAKSKLQADFVLRLDELYDEKGLSKRERERLGDMILEIASGLLAQGNNPQLEEICDKYRPRDAHPKLNERQAEILAAMKAEFSEMTGVDLGDDAGELSYDEFMQRAEAHLHEQFAAEERAREERKAKRKKTAKQLAKQQKEAEDAQDIKLSVREIYRKLASNLHPDRESDPEQRARKTELMQRVNQAYEKTTCCNCLNCKSSSTTSTPQA